MLTPESPNIPSDSSPQPVGPASPRALIFAWSCVALAVVCAVVVKLSIPAMMLSLIAFLTLPKGAKAPKIALALAVPFILVGLVRFTILEAAPGVVEGGRRAVARGAIAHLRDIVMAEDIARQQAFVDPDEDGIGSAVTLWTLAGHAKGRGAKDVPMLLQRFRETAGGKENAPEMIVYDGYVFAVYLPSSKGASVATTTNRDGDIDDEQAERRYVAYAWPLEAGHAERAVIFIDEHERILISDNEAPTQRYYGPTNPPRFDAALQSDFTGLPVVVGKPVREGGASDEGIGRDQGVWRRWRHKEGRATLLGDRAAAGSTTTRP